MTGEQFQNELSYAAELDLLKQLLAMEAITQKDFQKIQKSLIEKYRPVVDSLREAVSAEE